MNIPLLSKLQYTRTMLWAILLSALIVGLTATLARASYNLHAALVAKPDLAIYLLLPDEELKQTTLLREEPFQRDYLAETKSGPKLIRLKKGDRQWYVELQENLH